MQRPWVLRQRRLNLVAKAAALIEALRIGIADARLLEVKRCPATSIVAVSLEIDVERPQRLAHPIAATECIAVLAIEGDLRPSVLSLRSDFPPDGLGRGGTPSLERRYFVHTRNKPTIKATAATKNQKRLYRERS